MGVVVSLQGAYSLGIAGWMLLPPKVTAPKCDTCSGLVNCGGRCKKFIDRVISKCNGKRMQLV
jgi:hypothetical protein